MPTRYERVPLTDPLVRRRLLLQGRGPIQAYQAVNPKRWMQVSPLDLQTLETGAVPLFRRLRPQPKLPAGQRWV